MCKNWKKRTKFFYQSANDKNFKMDFRIVTLKLIFDFMKGDWSVFKFKKKTVFMFVFKSSY